MSLGLQEVYELGLLGDGALHFHLLMGVHSLQVELSEHHYCHECLLKNFIPHTETDTNGQGVCVCVSISTSEDLPFHPRPAHEVPHNLRVGFEPWTLISRCVCVCVQLAAPGCSPAGTPGRFFRSSAGRSGPGRPAAPGSDGRCGSSEHPSAAAASLAAEATAAVTPPESDEEVRGKVARTSSSSLCLRSRSLSSFCCRLRAFISSMACFFSRSLSW